MKVCLLFLLCWSIFILFLSSCPFLLVIFIFVFHNASSSRSTDSTALQIIYDLVIRFFQVFQSWQFCESFQTLYLDLKDFLFYVHLINCSRLLTRWAWSLKVSIRNSTLKAMFPHERGVLRSAPPFRTRQVFRASFALGPIWQEGKADC